MLEIRYKGRDGIFSLKWGRRGRVIVGLGPGWGLGYGRVCGGGP